MVKCFQCGMNLNKWLEEGNNIKGGMKIGDKFSTYNREEFNEFLIKKKVDDCCRIILITYVPNRYLHHY